MRVGRAADYLLLALRKPLHCEGRATSPHPLCLVIWKEICSALGKSLPVLRPLPSVCVCLEFARWSGGRMFEDAQGLVLVYGLAREQGLHNVSTHAAA